ncbi:MAG: NAD(P)H-dependent oxidoreductase subunit E [Bacteroidales bacterium]|nr:NAD(P)H-dependent oxidoreductase subunit E [Bacteroidales bacterium]HPD94791.1 NAD(P)H-dependent oxidoreductase subunit E [Tenuifilaceae bacterium]HRX30768.1 NAD(P)H-dependent oxidoreductase subunit E [Tenuifilaceae bacterium]
MEKIIDEVLEQNGHAGMDSLIPILQEIQDRIGCLTEEVIIRVSEHLNVPTSKIYGLATFYNQFRFEKKGKYHIRICNGTSCRLNGSKWLIEYIEKNLKIKNGETSRNGIFSLEVVNCMGACEFGPVISINDQFYKTQDPDSLKELLDELSNEE